MITKNDILTFTKHVVRRGRGLPDRRIMHPLREWAVGVLGATLFLGAGAGYAGWLFLTQAEQLERPVAYDIDMVEYDAERVNMVLEVYRARAEEFERLQREQRVVPSATSTETTPASNEEEGVQTTDAE